MKLSSLLLPQVVLGAAILPRQNSDNGSPAYSGWSAADQTYDGREIIGTFPTSNNDNSSAPGVTLTESSNGSQDSSQQLNITVQNLTPDVEFQDIFVVAHSDRIRLFEVGKPLSNELGSFVANGSVDAFMSLNLDNVYGNTTVSQSLAPGQYYNFSLPLSLPSFVRDERLHDALDDLDASLTLVGRFADNEDSFFAVNAMDLGDRRESDSAAAYTTASGFLTLHSGAVNGTSTFFPRQVAYILSSAE